MLQHKFEIENKDGSRETRTSTLAEYGAPTGSGGYSAMAKLVGIRKLMHIYCSAYEYDKLTSDEQPPVLVR